MESKTMETNLMPVEDALDRSPPSEQSELVGTTEAIVETTTFASSASDSGDEPGTASGEEIAVARLNSKELDQLLDELTGELVALEDFPHEIDDRAFEHEWLGKHTDLSLTVFQAELLKTRKHTDDVDRNGKLLSDPVKSRLARGSGARITVRVHHELSEDQKNDFILCLQARDRDRTKADNQELKRKIIQRWLVLGLDYDEIAKLASVCANTVRNVEKRAAADSNSKLGNTKRPDRRYKPATLEKIAKAAELRKEGMGDADIAAIFDTDVETVGKWRKDPADPATKKTESGKGKKATATESESIEDIAASDDMPERHRWAVERLGWFPEDYAQLEGECRDAAKEAVKNVSTVDNELLSHSIYGRHLIAFAEKMLEQRHRSVAAEDRGDEAPPDAGGVIAEGGTCIVRPPLPEDGSEDRARVNGFDPEPVHPDRESMVQDDRTRAVEPNLDDRSSPYEKYFGRKGEPKK